ncbi:uncharacterized protein LOC143246259 isoform X1 [Tachypleus tridentatus]|uniref:uncharacterized protein LOC143246259 isoform X1 n=1 Tax=Tachypleus tridentatus TaxID=6853 RepID=UPI003FD1208B
MSSITDRLGLDNEVRELRLGKSFTNSGNTAFHSVRYDFKPASVDPTKGATVDIGEGHQVTVSVPHIEGSGTSKTVFKGSKKPYTKECVLIINHSTGEVTLEKLSCNIQLKKTRAEGSSRIQQRPITPIDNKKQSSSPSQKHSPTQKTPHSPSQKLNWSASSHYSPNQRTSPYQRSPTSQPSPSMPSLLAPSGAVKNNTASKAASMPLFTQENHAISNEDVPDTGILSDSSDSSSSSSSSASSDSESEAEVDMQPEPQPPPKSQGTKTNGQVVQQYSSPSLPSMPKFSQLSEDLQLSESGSDSDD